MKKQKATNIFTTRGPRWTHNFNVLQDGMVNTEWSLLYSAMLSVFE